MIVGYARTSTTEQMAGFEAPERDLRAAGAERIFKEQTSSVGQRKALEEALDFVRDGDVLVVTKLDRLARSVEHLGQLVKRLEAKGVALRILGMGVDTGTPTGRLMVNLVARLPSSNARSCLSANAKASRRRNLRENTKDERQPLVPRPLK